MSPETRSTAGHDERLLDIVETYLARLAAGTAESPEVVLARHPEFKTELSDFFHARAQVDGVVAPLRQAVQADSPDHGDPAAGASAVPRELGDFRILREVGRGGMGIVYEADQLSLGRRVALKVLPFAATMDSRQLQRFQNEARAAAQLHHTNIVPVYFVGCERGVHFYAMQFIEGQSLAEIIAGVNDESRMTNHERMTNDEARNAASDTPQAAVGTEIRHSTLDILSSFVIGHSSFSRRDSSFFRTIAELGIQAAEALDHAHQLGIVHRDVKPANLLVENCQLPTANCQLRLWITDFGLAQIQSDARLTITGDLVGTLRYMSPEQALAKRVVVDHRTDIYSLGATLYELMTLEPAFGGTDRQELLRQIAFEEPRALRRLNKHIPAELETIVLKSMEKNPADRYATAKELADDLRHWLEDKPIRARRATLLQQARKWTRRHRALTGSAAVVIVIAVLVGGANWYSWSQNRLATEREVESAVREALDAKSKGRLPESLAAVRRAVSLQTANSVGPELQERILGLQADLVMLSNLESILLESTAVKDGKFDTRQRVDAYARAFREYGIDCEALDQDHVAALIRKTNIAPELAAALTDWALQLDRQKEDRTFKRLLAIARDADPDVWRNQLRDMYAQKDKDAVLKLAATVSIADVPPQMLSHLGTTLKLIGAVPEAVSLLSKAAQKYPGDFWINWALANSFLELESPNWEAGHRHYLAALAIRPKSPGAWLNVGYVLEHKGQRAEAITAYEEAIHLKSDYVEAYINLGSLRYEKNEFHEAIRAYTRAIDIDPARARAYYHLGNSLSEIRAPSDEIIEAYKKAVSLDPEYHKAWGNLGIAYVRNHESNKAVDALQQAVRTGDKDPLAYLNLGNVLYTNREFDKAIDAFNKALVYKKDWAEAHAMLGLAMADKGALEEAVGHAKTAANLRPRDHLIQNNLAIILERAKLFDEAMEARRRAACAAAVAGCAKGSNADQRKLSELARLRGQALAWLQADLSRWRLLLEKVPDKAPPFVREAMQTWQQEKDLAGVRDTDSLAKLPEAERQEWQTLWVGVEELRKMAAKPAK
jgi:serine/threonine protein kinase/Flp pilus assembly protein TadD